jgi:hypothetical protein
VSLQTALLNEARPDRRNVGLGIANRALRCMDRVVPEDEIVFVWNGRAENELGIGQRFEFDRVARRLASCEVSVSQFVQGSTRRPDAMATQRRCVPLGARQGGRERARCIPVATKEDARWNAGTSSGAW